MNIVARDTIQVLKDQPSSNSKSRREETTISVSIRSTEDSSREATVSSHTSIKLISPLEYAYTPITFLVARREGDSFKYVGMMKGADKEAWFKADCPAGTYYAYVRIHS